MKATQTQIKAKLVAERFRKPGSDWAISQFRVIEGQEGTKTGMLFTATGANFPTEKGVLCTLYGEWTTYKGAPSFKVSTCSIEAPSPTSKEDVMAYVLSLHCGIGKQSFEKLWKHFGADLVSVMETDPARIKKVARRCKVDAMTSALSETNSLRSLIKFFSPNPPFSIEVMKRIIKKLDGDAVDHIKCNPYCLAFVDGIGFKAAEAIAVKLNNGSPAKRTHAAILYAVKHCTVEGHIYLLQEQLIAYVQNLCKNANVSHALIPSEQEIIACINILDRKNYLVIDNDAIYDPELYAEERKLAANIVRISSGKVNCKYPPSSIRKFIAEYELKEGITLAVKQREAVVSAVTSSFSVITGGAGTGKTTVVKAILWILTEKLKEGKAGDIQLMAPTGRAARRMSEVTYLPAQTIHKAANIRVDAEGGTALKRDSTGAECYGIDAKTIIIDEASMIDQHIANELLTQIAEGVRVIMLGDPGQLPSVGAGNVLNEIIRSNSVPTTKLDQIFRQAEDNPIVHNSLMIQKGSLDFVWNKQFQMHEVHGSENLLHSAVNFYLRCIKQFSVDDVILLNPYRKGNLTVDMFNKEIQSVVNPATDQPTLYVKGTEFRIGDRVMQTKNQESGVANGDIGVITKIYKAISEESGTEEYFADITFDGEMKETYSSKQMESVCLAYCTTVHKSQGGQWKIVIMILFPEHRRLLQRNLLYTGITRAREGIALFGEQYCIKAAVANNMVAHRNTNLSSRIQKNFKEMNEHKGTLLRKVSNLFNL